MAPIGPAVAAGGVAAVEKHERRHLKVLHDRDIIETRGSFFTEFLKLEQEDLTCVYPLPKPGKL